MDGILVDTSGGGGVYIAAGLGPNAKPVKTAFNKEYIVGLTGYAGASLPHVLAPSIDEITREQGWRVYDAMHTDPVAQAAFNLFRMAVLAEGFTILPALDGVVVQAYEVDVHAKANANVDTKADTSPPKPATPEQTDKKVAAEAADFCRHALATMSTPITNVLWEIMNNFRYGSALAEIVFKDDIPADTPASPESNPALASNPYAKFVVDKIKVKPRWAFWYVTDAAMNLTGILARTVTGLTQAYLSTEQLIHVAWDSHDSDPRGRSIYRPAFNAWTLKIYLWPEFHKHNVQFGSPSLVATCEADAATQVQKGDGTTATAQQAISEALLSFQSGSALVLPPGWDVKALDIKNGGEAFRLGFELLDRQIVMAIIGNPRVLLEAAHSSKADNEGAQDGFGLNVRRGRQLLCDAMRLQLLRRILVINFGEAYAAKYCPVPSLGDSEHQDIATLMMAVAKLVGVNFFGESQYPAIDSMLGLPVRTPEDMAQRQAQNEATLAAAQAGANPTPAAGDSPDPKKDKGAKP